MGFPPNTVVDVEQVDDTNWKVLRAIRYVDDTATYVAEIGAPTDFASVPKIFVWLMPRYGKYTKAAIIHDYLWREGVAKNEITLRHADALFRRAMSELYVPFLTRWVMWAGVRWGAAMKGGPALDWWKDFPVVLLLTLLMAPVIVPTAIVILAAMGVFLILEAVVWVVLKAWSLVSRLVVPARPPRAPVNPPAVSWKL